MQVVINKCFLLNPEKSLVQIRIDRPETMVTGSLKLSVNMLTAF